MMREQQSRDLQSAGLPGRGAGVGGEYRERERERERRSEKGREVTLLETGFIVERVDLEREKKERRKAEEREEKERKRQRKMSRASAVGILSPTSTGGAGATTSGGDASSMHSLNAPMQGVHYNYGASRSQISLTASSYPTPNPNSNPNSATSTRPSPDAAFVAGAGRRLSSPMTQGPPRPDMPRGTSQSSLESGRAPRFFGFRHWSGAFGSEASVHHSGSMMDMQYVLSFVLRLLKFASLTTCRSQSGS